MDREAADEMMNEFQAKHGELLTLRANIAAINRMLVRRGKRDELFGTVKEIIEEFEAQEDAKS